jgi:hypothetical protein
MTAAMQPSKNRKGTHLLERAPSVDREWVGSKLSNTLQWLANNPVVQLDEQIELILVTWHPLILEDSYCDDSLAAQHILDETIRKCSPRSTMVCGAHRVWWLLNSGTPVIKLKSFKGRIARCILKNGDNNPMLEKLEDSLIVQRIGSWNGPTTNTAKGLAGIFADMAAGQTLLDNFGLPFERQHRHSQNSRVKHSAKTVKPKPKPKSSTAKKTKPSHIGSPLKSGWIHSPKHNSWRQSWSTSSRQAPLLQLS